MRKIMLIAAALVAGAVGVSQTAAAQDVKPKVAAEEMQVTGMVTKADEQKGEITIGDKSFVLSNEVAAPDCAPQQCGLWTTARNPTENTVATK